VWVASSPWFAPHDRAAGEGDLEGSAIGRHRPDYPSARRSKWEGPPTDQGRDYNADKARPLLRTSLRAAREVTLEDGEKAADMCYAAAKVRKPDPRPTGCVCASSARVVRGDQIWQIPMH